MARWTFDQAATKRDLNNFFVQQRRNLTTFGSTVNQTFEAFVFASVIGWYRSRGWSTTIVNPVNKRTKKPQFRLKFSTRGEPDNFSYAIAKKGTTTIQIRHQLRVSTKAHVKGVKYYANICPDVAVIKNVQLSSYKTYMALPNIDLVTFGEAKHMSAFAELLAGFIGMVHELQPARLSAVRAKQGRRPRHLAPFLFVSGLLFTTASIEYTVQQRNYDIDIYSSAKQMSLAFSK